MYLLLCANFLFLKLVETWKITKQSNFIKNTNFCLEPVFKPHNLLLQFLSMTNQFTWRIYLDCVLFYFQSIVLRFAKYINYFLNYFYFLICADLLLMNSASCPRSSNNSLSLLLHIITDLCFIFLLLFCFCCILFQNRVIVMPEVVPEVVPEVLHALIMMLSNNSLLL